MEQRFYLFDVSDHECCDELFVISSGLTKDIVRKFIFMHEDYFMGSDKLVGGLRGRTLEEAVAVVMENEGDEPREWRYKVRVYDKGPINASNLEVLRKYTGKSIIIL